MNNLGKIAYTLLSFVFEQESFDYQKISHIAEQHKKTARDSRYSKDPYVYALPYSHPYIRKALWSFKYRNNKKLGACFANLLQPLITEQCQNMDNPLLVYVPSSPESNLRRGYDSNQTIINTFSRHVDIEIAHGVFKKRPGAQKQSRTKTRTERLQNPKGAFVLKKKKIIQNRNIILFDDVLTTGATVNEIKKILLRSGAKSVTIITLCH